MKRRDELEIELFRRGTTLFGWVNYVNPRWIGMGRLIKKTDASLVDLAGNEVRGEIEISSSSFPDLTYFPEGSYHEIRLCVFGTRAGSNGRVFSLVLHSEEAARKVAAAIRQTIEEFIGHPLVDSADSLFTRFSSSCEREI